MIRLCFGTFAQILRLCKREMVTDCELVGTMTRTVDPNCQYIDSKNDRAKSAVSRLLSCGIGFSSGNIGGGNGTRKKSSESLSRVVALAPSVDKADLIQKFGTSVIGLIDEDKKRLAVLALFDIIRKDTELDSGKRLSFKRHLGTTKEALLNQSVVALDEFLSGLFLYTVIEVKNTVGKECVKDINAEYIAAFADVNWAIEVRNRALPEIEEEAAATKESSETTDSSFDEQVDTLNDILCELISHLKEGSQSEQKAATRNFYIALQETVRLGRIQHNAVGEKRTFINNITDLFAKWKEIMIRRSDNLSVDTAESDKVFEGIVREVSFYIEFRGGKLIKPIHSSAEKVKPNFAAYLRNANNKYCTVKTLLYNDQPKPFYDFYVCNDIERRTSVAGKFGYRYRYSTLSNVTVKSLTECSHFVILAGTGGLGKSMMMRHLLLNSIENYTEMLVIPVFIPLKDFDETVGSLLDYIYSKIAGMRGNITEEQFEETLNDGKCLLLFDGLDEIGSINAKRFESELEIFTDKYPDNYYVISSRPNQSFISYSRFMMLQLKPFSKKQALMLIDNLEFRPDEPIIKEKFRTALDGSLYQTHSAFIENPLLLTIMLMTFEQYAEVPSKMHVFYREAFAALSVKHDASKGAYKRTLKTGLTADRFAEYFAELCSRSYYDEKFEMTEEEFTKYYDALKEREKTEDLTSTASDYLYDLCSNMCLMYFESGKYHFTHRSFQEYFCALYFSKQKDKNLENIGNFFENRHSRMYGDKTFNMLYDMIPDKIEEYIFLPFLTKLYDHCDNAEGYWTFLETLYPSLNYEKGETNDFISNDPQSYLFDFIKQLNGYWEVDCDSLPKYDSLVKTEYVYVIDEDGSATLVDAKDVDCEFIEEHGSPDAAGCVYEFDIEAVRQRPTEYKELLDFLDNDEFVLKEEYMKIREYLEKLKAKQKPTGSSLFDLF